MKLEIGGKYKTRNGLDAECVGVNPFPHQTNDNWIVVVMNKTPQLVWCFENGNWMGEVQDSDAEYDLDIVAEA